MNAWVGMTMADVIALFQAAPCINTCHIVDANHVQSEIKTLQGVVGWAEYKWYSFLDMRV